MRRNRTFPDLSGRRNIGPWGDEMIQIEVQKNLVGLEDMLLGVGTVTQRRGKQDVTITKINAANFPYDADVSLAEKAALIDSQYQFIVDRMDLIQEAVNMGQMLEYMQVHIDQLALWLTVGDNQLSAFKPFAQRVTQDEVLPANLNFAVLDDTVIEEDVVITVGSNSHVYWLKGEEFTP